jgi:uncharacterized membrane protein
MDDATDEPPAELTGLTEQTDRAEGHEILAIVLDKPTRANEVLLALAHLQGEGKLRMQDAVIVAKDDGGRSSVVETIDITPAKGAIAGAWWGLLGSLLVGGPAALAVLLGGAAAGALYGRLVDRGLDDDWVKGMADWIDPGTSALLLLVDSGFDRDVVTELRRFEGTGEVAYSTLPQGARDDIESALSGADRQPTD